nr:hypothetical protein [Mycobacteroides abscessus]
MSRVGLIALADGEPRGDGYRHDDSEHSDTADRPDPLLAGALGTVLQLSLQLALGSLTSLLVGRHRALLLGRQLQNHRRM